MTTLSRIAIPELAQFGEELLANGFKVYVFRSDFERVEKGGKESCATSIGFSRVVDGRECFGGVRSGPCLDTLMSRTPSVLPGPRLLSGGRALCV